MTIEKAHHVKIVRVVKLTYDYTIKGCDSDKEALYCALESFEGTLGGMIENIDGYEVLSQDIEATEIDIELQRLNNDQNHQ